MANKRTGTQRNRYPTLRAALPSLALGCVITWYLSSGIWLDGMLQASSSQMPNGGSSLLTCATTALSLTALCFGRTKLNGPSLRFVVSFGGLAASLLLVAIALAMKTDGASPALLRIAWSSACGIAYGLGLCAWAQNLLDKTVRGAMTSQAIGLSTAGCLLAIAMFGPPMVAVCLIALPFVSFTLFCAVAAAETHRPSTAKPSSPTTGRRKRVPYAALYAVLMGFATTQFFALNGSDAPAATTVCMVAASGIVFLFVSQFLIRALGTTWCLFLVGMLFGIVVAFWLVLPEASALVAVTTATLHWASVLLVASAAFEPGRSRRHGAASTACALLAMFYSAAGFGSLTIFLGTAPRAVICMGAIVVLLLTFLLARRENAPAPTNVLPLDEGAGRHKALLAFAQTNSLTPRETEVFTMIAEGNTLRHIADELVLSENTVKRHRTNVYQKLDVSSRQELIDKTRGC